MSELVNRVAEAIYESAPQWGALWDKNEEIKASYLEQARAAIQAMREPTETMMTAADVETKEQALTIWREMIDEALK